MIKAILQTMRPRQWTKNAILFAALIFDRQLSWSHPEPLLRSLMGVGLFCLLASSVYILNDLMDLEADRQHPRKRNRPIASGRLPVNVAVIEMIALLVVALVGGFWLSPPFFWILALYFGVNVGYSVWLKQAPLIDVMMIAFGFLLRVASGVAILAVEYFSPWLYVVVGLGALSLGFGKRRAELTLLTDHADGHRRALQGYNLPLLDQLLTIVLTSTILTYSLYTFSAPNLPTNHAMMLTIPFVLYGVFRYLTLVYTQQAGGEPEEILLKDRPLQVAILLWGLTVVVLFYLLPLYQPGIFPEG